MSYLTRYNRKIKLTLVKATTVTCLLGLFFIPMIQNKIKDNIGYYTVVLNGQELGAVNSVQEANEALANARKRLSSQYEEVVYMNPDYKVYKQSRLVGTRVNEEVIENAIYENLEASIVDIDSQIAYTVRINDFTVTVGSKDDVVKLIEGAKKNYDTNNEFQVNLIANQDHSAEYSIDLVKSGFGTNDNDIVAAALDGDMKRSVSEGEVSNEGLTGITFEQDIIVNETTAISANVMSVEDALAEVTKEREAETIYIVEMGDTISEIAANNGLSMDELFKLNEGLTVDSLIRPGDQLIITVPTPELSVVTIERQTYEEDYEAEVQYIDNDSMYRGQSKIIQSGTTGYRVVTADVKYINGSESERTIIEQTIISESTPKIVEVGTMTPPTYVKPIYGGRFTSGFEYRWGSFHSGIDWACSMGTPVMATAPGKVIRASWYSGYGYCVDIQHANGVVSRYGHLSKFNVSVGATVSQRDVIAYSGNTGNSTGPHVHFEIIINGRAVNPLNYVNKY